MSKLLTANEWQGEEGQRWEGTPAHAPANREPAAGVFPVPESGADAIGRANKPRTFDEAVHEVAEREAGLRRDPFPVSQIRIEPGRLIADGRAFLLGQEGLSRLCRRFQAPANYISRLNPELQARILQYHFAEGRHPDPKFTDKTSCIISRGDTFLDITRSDLLKLDNAAVLQALRAGVGADASVLEVQNLHLNDESLVIDVVSPRLAEEVRQGDVIRAGVHVSHSQLDGEATQVMAYVLRLVCKNGMVQRECLGAKRGSTPRARRLPANRPESLEKQISQVGKLVADTWSKLQEKLGVISCLQRKRVDVRTALERFLIQAHLFSRGLMDQLLQAWEEEGAEATAFGALNALTRIASHAPGMPGWKRQRLARLAGVYAGQDVHLCPHCFSIIATR